MVLKTTIIRIYILININDFSLNVIGIEFWSWISHTKKGIFSCSVLSTTSILKCEWLMPNFKDFFLLFTSLKRGTKIIWQSAFFYSLWRSPLVHSERNLSAPITAQHQINLESDKVTGHVYSIWHPLSRCRNRKMIWFYELLSVEYPTQNWFAPRS